MSHRLPDLTSADLRVVSRWLDDDGSLRILREPSSADLIVAIRAEVESGTIKGEVVEQCVDHVQDWLGRHTSACRFSPALVIPVDGGEDR